MKPNRPTFDPIWLACKACEHQWDDWTPQWVPAQTLIAHWKTYRCPKCGAGLKSVLLRTTPLAPAA